MIDRAVLRHHDGDVVDGCAWLAADAVDERVLRHAIAPVLDIGCGPGRHVAALAHRGLVALGIDIAPSALAVARDRGAIALERSVFARVPAAGRWRTALLLDGNVGIGGDPEALLRRVREVLRPRGSVIVEAETATTADTRTVRIEVGNAPGPWFELATVAIDDVARLAHAAGLVVMTQWTDCGREFAHLVAR